MSAAFRAVPGLEDGELVLVLNRRMRRVLYDIVNSRADEAETSRQVDPKNRQYATLLKAFAQSLDLREFQRYQTDK